MKPSKLTLNKLRHKYFDAWKREWPYEDEYLTELWLEARERHNQATARRVPPIVWDDCLIAMREDHPQ